MQEEDVDDLDDIVDQFDAKNTISPSQPPTSTSTVLPQPTSVPSSSRADNAQPALGSTADTTGIPSGQLPDELAKDLADGMEALMRELAEGQTGQISEEDRKRKEAWEKMLIEGMDGMVDNELLGRNERDKPSTENENAGGSSSSKKAVDDFQASILQAMEKLKDSDSTLHTDASTSSAPSDDPLEAILNQLGSGLDESGEDNGDLQDMLETMMQQLMSKEVLYEPLKELHDKFPGYLSENDEKLSTEDKERFRNQMTRVSAIMQIFEDPSYKEDDQEKGAQIVSLMNEMQSFGSPPSEIMGSLPAGLDFGPDGTPKLPDGCTIM
ncbi:Pex19-domain-containing protein [Fomitiporia mediterranea MF3/22]|uniref:Pex19-domain-containing protein n=1 Tax=Fomitiporia mediterranea (strain MF3/22) TaxID=694068 RepID=UPI00044087F0|nr:Pex19-domain-containing protein [Fomitiporia mediterranea MF3/22]EJD08510.1 Pex19-domain-containing protein [Fomitiporia mediterranea MF3/22]